MKDAPAIISMKIDTKDPIELSDFAAMFSGLASQFDRYIKAEHPDLDGDAKIYVKELRPGSIEADLVPWALAIIDQMDRIIIVDQFIERYCKRLLSYFKVGGRAEEANKGELGDLMNQVRAIANDPNGTAEISSVTYHDKSRDVRASVKFNIKDARTALQEIEHHKVELDQVERVDHTRVLMTFKRSDVGSAVVGKRSGERVIIEDVSDKDLALIYASPLTEQRIKHEMRDTDENIYKKGFVVDVNVQRKGGKPVACAVTDVHQIIDLPDED